MITDVKVLLAKAKAAGLNLITNAETLDSSGLDFLVLHAKDEYETPWIVRTPRHPNAYEGTINEAKALKLLGRTLAIEVPDWRIHTKEIIAYPRLKGLPGWSVDQEKGLGWNVDPAAPQESFLKSTAQFLVDLHRTDLKDVKSAGIRLHSIEDIRSRFRDAFNSTKDILRPSEALWQRWQQWVEDDSYWPKHEALVHGDFHPGHMLIDSEFNLTGVLDWTEAETADFTVDFSIFFGCFGKDTLKKFIRYYTDAGGPVYSRLEEHVIERWAAYAPLIDVWGVKNNNDGIIEHARGHLKTTEEGMA